MAAKTEVEQIHEDVESSIGALVRKAGPQVEDPGKGDVTDFKPKEPLIRQRDKDALPRHPEDFVTDQVSVHHAMINAADSNIARLEKEIADRKTEIYWHELTKLGAQAFVDVISAEGEKAEEPVDKDD